MEQISFTLSEIRSQAETQSNQLETPCQELARLVRQFFVEHPDAIAGDATAIKIQVVLQQCDRMGAKHFQEGDRILITNSSGGLVEGSIVSQGALTPGSWRVRYPHAGGELVDEFPEYRLIVPVIPAVLEGVETQ